MFFFYHNKSYYLDEVTSVITTLVLQENHEIETNFRD